MGENEAGMARRGEEGVDEVGEAQSGKRERKRVWSSTWSAKGVSLGAVELAGECICRVIAIRASSDIPGKELVWEGKLGEGGPRRKEMQPHRGRVSPKRGPFDRIGR